MNVKKIIGVIAGIIITFTGGFFSGSFNSSGKIEKLENRTVELESKLVAETKRAEDITTGLRKSDIELGDAVKTIEGLEKTNSILIDSNNKLKTENKRITETVGNISSGITEDKKRISGIIKGMDYYIEQGEKENNILETLSTNSNSDSID